MNGIPPILAAADGAERTLTRFAWGAPLHGLPGLLALIAGAVVIALVVTLYRRERPAARPGLRWLSAGLRLVVLAALAGILFRPSLVRDRELTEPGRLVVLVDRSASMSVRDPGLPPGDLADWADALGLRDPAQVAALSRHRLVHALLDGDPDSLLPKLAQRNQVEVLTFAASAREENVIPRTPEPPTTGPAPALLPDWRADGTATDLSAALRAALKDAADGRLAAVLLITDGRVTAGGSPLDELPAQPDAVPVHVIGVGNPERPRNVRLSSLTSRDHAMAGLPLAMQASVRASGFAGRTAQVVLTATDVATGESVEVLRRDLVLAADGDLSTVDLAHVPPRTGTLRYTALVRPLPGEEQDDDNAASREVVVSEDRLSVLLVAGVPSREYRFLRPLIDRDPAFDLTAVLHDEGGASAGDLPRDRASLGRYDVIVLCDPAPAEAGGDWLGIVRDLVDSEGIGLVYAAGPAHTPALLAARGGGPLADLLPVRIAERRTEELIGSGRLFSDPRPVERDPLAAGHPILDGAAGPESQDFWSAAPGIYWVLPVRAPKPGATVLLRCADPEQTEGMPLAAVQPYGAGRVFWCGTSGTWRWRSAGVEHYERFWLQAIRYCAAERLGGRDRRARIILDRYAYDPGDAVTIRLRLLDVDLEPVTGAAPLMSVACDAVPCGTLSPRAGAEPGVYEDVFYPDGFGHYSVVYEGEGGVRASEGFDVRRPEAEFRDTRQDVELLRGLAAATGGRYVRPSEIAGLPDAIPDRTRVSIRPGPLEPLWDVPWLLALLVCALTAEWIARKGMGLL